MKKFILLSIFIFILCLIMSPACVTDTDGDSISDNKDNCPNIFNPMQTDFDADGIGDACDALPSCKEIKEYTIDVEPKFTDGIYTIDPDGDKGPIEPFQVYCDLTTDNRGWTLVLVASDDKVNTWTWNNMKYMTTDTTLIGDLYNLNKDFKSLAYHTVKFKDLLFKHAPSGVWAAYNNVGDGTLDMGNFLALIPYPVCKMALAGNGYEMSAGTLTKTGQLCDTDLYFNLGDHETKNETTCKDLKAAYNHATFGPAWSRGNNDGCPFDDPSGASLGPSNPCGQCSSTDATTEMTGVGFGAVAGLNKGTAGAAQNYIQMYVY